jgi:hypothetical protein
MVIAGDTGDEAMFAQVNAAIAAASSPLPQLTAASPWLREGLSSAASPEPLSVVRARHVDTCCCCLDSVCRLEVWCGAVLVTVPPSFRRSPFFCQG